MSVAPVNLGPAQSLLVEGTTGRLHVVNEDGHLIGLISRTDLLRHYRLYESMSRRVA